MPEPHAGTWRAGEGEGKGREGGDSHQPILEGARRGPNVLPCILTALHPPRGRDGDNAQRTIGCGVPAAPPPSKGCFGKKKGTIFAHARSDLQWTPPSSLAQPAFRLARSGIRDSPSPLTEREGGVGGEVSREAVVGRSIAPVMLRRGRILAGYNTPPPSAWFRSGWKLSPPADRERARRQVSPHSRVLVLSCTSRPLRSPGPPSSLPFRYLSRFFKSTPRVARVVPCHLYRVQHSPACPLTQERVGATAPSFTSSPWSSSQPLPSRTPQWNAHGATPATSSGTSGPPPSASRV